MLKLWAFVLVLITLHAKAGYELSSANVIGTCPFFQKDQYSFDPILSQIRDHLDTKVEQNEECIRAYRGILSSAEHIDRLFASRKIPGLQEELLLDFNSQRVTEIEIELRTLDPTNENNSYQIQSLQDQLLALQAAEPALTADALFNQKFFQENRNAYFHSEMVKSLNTLYTRLGSLSPLCADKIGGQNVILPSILHSTSYLSGASTFAHADLTGGLMQLFGSLNLMLADQTVKRASLDLTQVNNKRILACSYLAMQRNICDLRQSLRHRNETEKILRLIGREYSPGNFGEYEQLARLTAAKKEFERFFNLIAESGSIFSVDLNGLKEYLDAKVLNPEGFLASDPGPDAGNEVLDSWLRGIRQIGVVNIPERDFNGAIIAFPEQRENAIAVLENRQTLIDSTELSILNSLVFKDIRADSDVNSPEFYYTVVDLIAFLEKFIEDQLVSDRRRHIINDALYVLYEVKAFLDIMNPNDHDAFQDELSEQGAKLFKIMAYGTIPQLSNQTVIFLPQRVVARIDRALNLAVQEFYDRDIEQNSCDFVRFQRQETIRAFVIENYMQYRPDRNVFRQDVIDTTVQSFHRGFRQEILQTLEDVLNDNTKLSNIPELDGLSKSHLCALYAPLLKQMLADPKNRKKNKAETLLNKCIKSAAEIELEALLSVLTNSQDDSTPVCTALSEKSQLSGNASPPVFEASLVIDYDDPCFYPEYIELLEVQEFVTQQLFRKNSSARP